MNRRSIDSDNSSRSFPPPGPSSHDLTTHDSFNSRFRRSPLRSLHYLHYHLTGVALFRNPPPRQAQIYRLLLIATTTRATYTQHKYARTHTPASVLLVSPRKCAYRINCLLSNRRWRSAMASCFEGFGRRLPDLMYSTTLMLKFKHV